MRYLLDENISPVIAQQLCKKARETIAFQITTWEEGWLIGASDEVVLQVAKASSLVLVTYDQSTIRPLLRNFAEQNIDHAGVVFIDHKTIRSFEFGTLVKALFLLWRRENDKNWINRVLYLKSEMRIVKK